MDIEQRLKRIEDYCFMQNNQFQTDVFEAIITKLETGESLGVGKRITRDNPAILAAFSPNKGFGFPQMTEDQRDNIMNPVGGLVIYNITSNKLNLFTTTWEEITSS